MNEPEINVKRISSCGSFEHVCLWTAICHCVNVNVLSVGLMCSGSKILTVIFWDISDLVLFLSLFDTMLNM